MFCLKKQAKKNTRKNELVTNVYGTGHFIDDLIATKIFEFANIDTRAAMQLRRVCKKFENAHAIFQCSKEFVLVEQEWSKKHALTLPVITGIDHLRIELYFKLHVSYDDIIRVLNSNPQLQSIVLKEPCSEEYGIKNVEKKIKLSQALESSGRLTRPLFKVCRYIPRRTPQDSKLKSLTLSSSYFVHTNAISRLESFALSNPMLDTIDIEIPLNITELQMDMFMKSFVKMKTVTSWTIRNFTLYAGQAETLLLNDSTYEHLKTLCLLDYHNVSNFLYYLLERALNLERLHIKSKSIREIAPITHGIIGSLTKLKSLVLGDCFYNWKLGELLNSIQHLKDLHHFHYRNEVIFINELKYIRTMCENTANNHIFDCSLRPSPAMKLRLQELAQEYKHLKLTCNK